VEVAGGKQSASIPSVKPTGVLPLYRALYVVVSRHDAVGVKGTVAGPRFGVVDMLFVVVGCRSVGRVGGLGRENDEGEAPT
jgi:hypothetical protein